MKLLIQGDCLYVDNIRFSHCEVKDEYRNKPFSCEAEARFSHHHSRELLHADGLGWVGAASECSVVLGRMVRGDGSVIPCLVTESRLIGIANFASEQVKRITLETEK